MTDSQGFENAWFSRYSSHNLKEHFSELRTFAYLVFDQLDLDGNGFIDEEELLAALENQSMSERERSFITFLLNNRQAIADSFDEGAQSDPDGISRQDIDAYFTLITQLVD